MLESVNGEDTRVEGGQKGWPGGSIGRGRKSALFVKLPLGGGKPSPSVTSSPSSHPTATSADSLSLNDQTAQIPSLVALLGVGKKSGGLQGDPGISRMTPCEDGKDLGGASSHKDFAKGAIGSGSSVQKQRNGPKAAMTKPWSLVVKDPLSAAASGSQLLSEASPAISPFLMSASSESPVAVPHYQPDVGPTLGEAAEAARRQQAKENAAAREAAAQEQQQVNVARVGELFGLVGGNVSERGGGSCAPSVNPNIIKSLAKWTPFPSATQSTLSSKLGGESESPTSPSMNPQREAHALSRDKSQVKGNLNVNKVRPMRKEISNGIGRSGSVNASQVAIAIWRCQQRKVTNTAYNSTTDPFEVGCRRREADLPPSLTPATTTYPLNWRSTSNNRPVPHGSWQPWKQQANKVCDSPPSSSHPIVPACRVHPGLTRAYAAQDGEFNNGAIIRSFTGR